MAELKNNNEVNIESLSDAAKMHRQAAANYKAEVKAQITVFLRTGVFVLALVAICILVFAWFVNSDQVKGYNMNVRSDEPDLFVDSLTTYNYKKTIDYNNNNNAVFTFEKHASIDDELTMACYDAIRNKNDFTSVVGSVVVSGSKVREGRPLTLVVRYNSGREWYTLDNGIYKINNYLSNIIDVKCGAISQSFFDDYAGYTGTNPDEKIWYAAKSYFQNDGQVAKTFLRVDSTQPSGYSKEETILFRIDTYEIREDGTALVYFQIDYYESLILEYVKSNKKTPQIGTSTIIDFENDLSEISVRVVE